MAMPQNKNLEELFNLESAAGLEGVDNASDAIELDPTDYSVSPSTMTSLEKVEAALPMIRDMSATDAELDELSKTALDGYKDLVDLGMNVDARAAAEILSVASSMLGHAITAKTAKINKKLKMIELQLKKAKLDQDNANKGGGGDSPEVAGTLLDRNQLLAMLKDRPQ